MEMSRDPWEDSRKARWEIEQQACALLGQEILRPLYLIAGAIENEHDFGSLSEFDEVSMGIEFVTKTGGNFRFGWRMSDINSGLAMGTADQKVTPFEPDVLDMIDSPNWRSLMGQQVIAVGIGWRAPESGSFRSAWSVRLSLEGGQSVVLALGEITERGKLQYIPDTVLVIFDEKAAKAYRPAGSESSAWGKIICESARKDDRV